MYSKYILPSLLKWRMNHKRFVSGRQWCVPQATGTVLEIGFGVGANLPYYTSNVSKLYALEPNSDLVKIALEENETIFNVEQIESGAEHVPLPEDSIDSIICTWTLCSVGSVSEVANEMYRVLKPQGKIIFIEHGQSQTRLLSGLQDAFNFLWKRCAGGCNLNRSYFQQFIDAGFALEMGEQIGTEYRCVATKTNR